MYVCIMICRFLFSPYTYVYSSLGCGGGGQHHINGIGRVANKENYCSRCARYYSERFMISTAFSLGVAKKKIVS